MRIVLLGFGSRGDVQPLIALGQGLQQAGYTVALAAGMNFAGWIEQEGLLFEPFHLDIEALMKTDLGKAWLGDSSARPWEELQNMRRMANAVAATVIDDLLALSARYDVFISGLLTVEAVATLAQAHGKRHLLALFAPLAPTRAGHAGMQALLPHSESALNRWWGYAIQAMLFTTLRGVSGTLRARLKLPPPTRRDFWRACNRTPSLVGVSPLVLPPPPDWGPHLHVTGYWFLDAAPGWQPAPALAAFLAGGAPPVYIGFGSMSGRDPQPTTQLMLAALRESGQRGILHSGWAGLHADDLPPEVFLLSEAPHAWLFPQMAAVIHHGGAGTTAAALRAGVPAGVVAHIGDQPYWGQRLHALGVGAAPLRRHQLTATRLAAMIRTLTTTPDLRRQAADLGRRIQAEDGIGRAVQVVQQMLRH